MCGITGILRFKGSKIEKHELKTMTDTLVHRGPDGDGQWVDESGKVGLGHRRLSIIDLSEHGSQPMHYIDRYTVVFNGEIYNYVEIKNDLIARGYSFRNNTDTEVLMAAYDNKGVDCLNDFDGMFAFVLYDKLDKKVFCARDRFGEKPFFYHFNGSNFYFASEMKALWASGISKKLDDKTVHNYLITGKNRGEKKSSTFYSGIKQLMASHSMIIDINEPKISQQRYWNINTTVSNISVDDAILQFDTLFQESIKRRLRSDVQVGSSLSGGLDSSMVVGYMADNKSIKQNTFSASFPGFARDEGAYQRMIVDKYSTNHYNTSPDMAQNMANFDKIIYHQEEPFGSASIAIQYEVFKLARQNDVTVLLDGQGADEILGGYPYFTFSYLRETLNKKGMMSFIKSARKAADKQAKSSKYFIGGTLSNRIPEKIINTFKSADVQTAMSLLNPDFLAKYQPDFKSDIQIFDTLNEALDDRTNEFGLDQLLRYSDRNAMAHSVEVRLPFLYHQLVDFVFSLPADLKIHDGWTKWIARKAARTRVPSEIIWRKEKVAYESPDNYLFQMKDNDLLAEAISDHIVGEYYKKNIKINDPKLFFRKVMLGKILMADGNSVSSSVNQFEIN